MADSADSRHILLSATTPDQFTEADKRADSIINVLRAGTTPFDSLVVKFSQDPGSVSNGGKYENITPNQFVPEYNKVLFITGQIGQLYKVRTSYGVHIVEVLKRSASTTQRAQVAYLRDAIVPSKQTQDDFFQQASKFIAENRDMAAVKAAVEKDGKLRVVATEAFDNTAYTLGALGFSNQTKDAICWAFSADEGDVSPEVYSFADAQRFYDNKYVVIGLNKVLPAGTPKVEDIRDRLEAELLAERKTAIVNQHIAGGGLQAIASKYGVTLDTLTNGAFDRPNMQGLGNELRVAGMAAKLQQGQTSPSGEGAYVSNTRKAVPGVATNLPQIRQRITRSAQGAVASYFLSSLRDAAAVEDDRSSFECN
ncbi:MAG: peptidylprolyl isomerase [Saprospiraceae bacterium]